MWVIFEGLDKSGKTTLLKRLWERGNYEYITLDRGPAGYRFYDLVRGRETTERAQKFLKMANHITSQNMYSDSDVQVLIVYVHASRDVTSNRLKEHNEKELKMINNTTHEQANGIYYRLCVSHYGTKNVMSVDTSVSNVDVCIDRILEEIEKRKAK